MLNVASLSVSYNTQPVFEHLHLEVPTATTTAIVGPSGSGKSTLLHAICGVIRIDSGTIAIDGHDITSLPTHRRGLGLVSQTGDLFPTMTVRENIEFGLKMNKMPRQRRHEIANEFLELIRLPQFADRYPDTLSGGQARRVALARTLAQKPSVLLLDEPLTGLDPEIHDELANDVASLLARAGITAVLVTHDRSEAEFLAHKVLDIRSLTHP